MQIFLLILGTAILLLNFFDFFHTTLSGYGFGMISGRLNRALSQIILRDKSRFIYQYSGFTQVLVTTFNWLFLLILGSFIIFLSGEEMVVHSTTHVPAGIMERLYYTCYLVSTVGIGDFVPGNDISRFFTAILSFSGFVLLTMAMTYLLSVVNAVLDKKKMAFHIAGMGGNLDQLYHFFTIKEDAAVLTQKSDELREMIIQNSSSYVFFPIIQYFLTRKKSDSAEIQLARLHEILIVLQNDFKKDSLEWEEIASLLNSIKLYLDMGLAKKENFDFDPKEVYELRRFWQKYDQTYSNNDQRDKNMHASLRSAGWTWADVYDPKKHN